MEIGGGVGWGGLPGQSRRAEGIRQKTKRDGSCQTMRVTSKLSLESSGRECYMPTLLGFGRETVIMFCRGVVREL